jgi:hypothetical protein
MPITEFARFMNRRGSSTQWTNVDEALYDGEIGVERRPDGHDRIKIGDGVTNWSVLPYFGYEDYNVASSTDILQKVAVEQAVQDGLDNDPRLPTADEKAALPGTNGSPSALNKYVTDSDPRIPTTDEKAALNGTNGSPSALNKYVTDTDPRNSDARTPVTHGNLYHSSAFIVSGDVTYEALNTNGDVGQVPNTLAAGNDSRFPTANQKIALTGTYGPPGTGNEYVTKTDPKYSGAITQSIGYQIISHDTLSLTQTSDGTYIYDISEFNGGVGFDVSKISGFHVRCTGVCDSNLIMRDAYVYATIFGTSYAIHRVGAGVGGSNEAQYGQALIYVPIYSGQTSLTLEISTTSAASASFEILGATLAK